METNKLHKLAEQNLANLERLKSELVPVEASGDTPWGRCHYETAMGLIAWCLEAGRVMSQAFERLPKEYQSEEPTGATTE